MTDQQRVRNGCLFFVGLFFFMLIWSAIIAPSKKELEDDERHEKELQADPLVPTIEDTTDVAVPLKKPARKRTPKPCTYNGHVLEVGPRGGCYYLTYTKTGKSRKKYVDRSYCNCKE